MRFLESQARACCGRIAPSFVAGILVCLGFVCFGLQTAQAKIALATVFVVQDETDGDKEPSEAEKIEADQKALADKYRLLEEKLFSLHEFEKGNNPIRSKLLERAYIQSQEKMTTSQLKLVVKLIGQSKLKTAENEQGLVLANLNQLLDLLQSEDRGKRVRDAIKRNQEYLKEVERILRIQKGLRGQTEGGLDPKRLANSQEKTAKRTKKLADEIRENEEGGEASSDSEQSDSDQAKSDNENSNDDPSKDRKKSDEDKDGDKKPGDKDKSPGGDKSKDKTPGQGEPGDQGEPKQDSKQGEPSDGEPGDGKPGDGKPGDGKPGQGEPGQPGQPQQGQPGQPGQGSPSDDGDQQESQQNPARKRIQAAEQRMRDAQRNLEDAKRGQAIEDMKKAEREMALAKKELEEILRQLRDEEVERTLAMLEGRFRQMLEREVKLCESTKKMEEIPAPQRGTEFEIKAGKLATEQNGIASEASRALMLLLEDGSSVAFPATVEEMHQDMLQVASRLSGAKVGRITIEIEEDIIDTLDYLVKALVKTQQDMERMKQKAQQGQMGAPGDQPLVDQLAEIKMLRGLQERIYRRHQRYSKFLEDPNDPVGGTDDPDLRPALQRLATKQEQLTNIARDIVNETSR